MLDCHRHDQGFGPGYNERTSETSVAHNGYAAALEARNNKGTTPLHWAALGGHTEAIQVLVDLAPNRVAALEAKTNKGSTPLHCAAQGGHAEAVRLLIDLAPDKVAALAAEGDGKTALLVAAWKGHAAVIRALAESVPDGVAATLQAKSRQGKTPLQYATGGGHDEAAEALRQLGAK